MNLNEDFMYILRKYITIYDYSSENVNHNLSKWFNGINIMPVMFWNQSRLQILEINTTIDLEHRH